MSYPAYSWKAIVISANSFVSSASADLHLHQPLCGKADQVAQNVCIGGLFHERAKRHLLIGHRCCLGLRWMPQPDLTGEIIDDHAREAARPLRR